MQVYAGADELKAAVGSALQPTDWVTIAQHQIDLFAEATDDHQWIHVDADRAQDGPFGRTIAHGFLTLSLLPSLIAQVYRIDGGTMGINYGLNRVRFTAPVPVGSRVRGHVELLEVSDVAGGVQVVNRVTVEIEGAERPALVAEWLTRRYF